MNWKKCQKTWIAQKYSKNKSNHNKPHFLQSRDIMECKFCNTKRGLYNLDCSSSFEGKCNKKKEWMEVVWYWTLPVYLFVSKFQEYFIQIIILVIQVKWVWKIVPLYFFVNIEMPMSYNLLVFHILMLCLYFGIQSFISSGIRAWKWACFKIITFCL